ncbi:hypothetical protein DFQ30_004694, partial [Apophysomyces sp. BC1015]
RTSTLLEQLGQERSWTEDQIDHDINILENNRLYFVRDLRVLSEHSWTVIELLPLVRDLLRRAIDPDWDGTYKAKEKRKKYRQLSANTRDGESNGVQQEDSSVSSSLSDVANEPTSQDLRVFTGRPIKAVSTNRIRVRTGAGEVFECDRFCPHKGVDLSTWGQVVGNSLICTKHNWQFGLEGGVGPKGRTVHPCKVNDW